MIQYGSTKGNGRMAVRRLSNEAPVVQTNDIASSWSAAGQAPGYILAATGTAVAADFAAPATALHLARWVPGGRSDDFLAVPCPFTNLIVGINGTLATAHRRLDKFPFPVTNALVIAPAFATNGLIPGVSEFWFTTNAAARYVWRNIAYERSASNLVSFAVTYCPNRDLIFEYGPVFPSNVLSLIQNGTNLLVLSASDEMQLRFNQGFTNVPPFSYLCPSVFICGSGASCGALAEHCSNRSFKFSFIADLGDGTADLDADGVSNYNEVMCYGTDPRSADTDQDGLADGAELAAGTDPRSFDTDADGLADSVDANPTNSNGNCYGQGTNWVAAAYGTNAAAIIAQGYENYVSSTVTNDVNGWWYSFTVTVSNFDDSGHAFIRVGDQAVVLARPVSGAASATFLLEQGRRYGLYVSPADNAAYAPSEPSAVIVPPTAAGAGSVTVAPTGLGIDPSTWHSSVSGGPQSFSAACHHAHPGLGAWSWTCADPTVHIDMPSNSATVVRWDWADVSWRTTNVVVTCALGDWTFMTNIWISCGTNDVPQVYPFLESREFAMENVDDDDGDRTADNAETTSWLVDSDLVRIRLGYICDSGPTDIVMHVDALASGDPFGEPVHYFTDETKAARLPEGGIDLHFGIPYREFSFLAEADYAGNARLDSGLVLSFSDTQSFLPIQAQLNAAMNLVELSTNDFLSAGIFRNRSGR